MCINYSQVETVTQYCDKVAELTDKVRQALTSVVDECGYLLGEVDETLEGIQAAARKLHRIENYKKALMIFAKTTGYVEDFIQEQMYAITGEEDYIGESKIPSNDELDKEKYTVSALICTATGEYADQLTWEQMLENANYIYAYLSGQGWTTEAICGLLGNMYRESKMNPGVWEIYNDDQKGYGIVQWAPAEDFFIAVDMKLADVNSLAETDAKQLMNIQLKFLCESMKPEGQRWLVGKTAENQYKKLSLEYGTTETMTAKEYCESICDSGDLALVFHACYERSGDDAKQLQERVDAANLWFKYFGEGQEISLNDFCNESRG